MQYVGNGDVYDVNIWPVHNPLPAGLNFLPIPLRCHRFKPWTITPTNHAQVELVRTGEKMRNLAERIRMHSANESMADHGHIQYLFCECHLEVPSRRLKIGRASCR